MYSLSIYVQKLLADSPHEWPATMKVVATTTWGPAKSTAIPALASQSHTEGLGFVSVASHTLTKAPFSWQVCMHSALARGNPVFVPVLDSVPGYQPSCPPPASQMLAMPPAVGCVKCFSPGIRGQSLTKVTLNISLQLAQLPAHLETEQTAKNKRHAVKSPA